MPNIRRVTVVEHIQERTGMYWPTGRDGIPHKSIWSFLLEEFALEFAAAQKRGKVSRIDIRHATDGRTISIECDGRTRTSDLQDVCNGKKLRGLVRRGRSPFGGLAYAMANALSETMSLEVFDGREWKAIACKCGESGRTAETAGERRQNPCLPCQMKSRRFSMS